VREAESVTSVQPLRAVPSDVKFTVPVGIGGPAGAIVAVTVTESPEVDGFRLEVSAVVVAPTTWVRVPLQPAFLLSPE
jgi:hypothetical protein